MTNFYSEDIIADIRSKQSTDLDGRSAIGDFYEKVFILSCKYASKVVGAEYIMTLLSDPRNSVAFRCIDTIFNIDNCPSILIYHKHVDDAKCENTYYILMICTKRSFKNMGYASSLLDDFIGRIHDLRVSEHQCKIVLSSLESSVTFYEEYGFKWMRTSLTDHPILMNYEKYEKDKEYFILELVIPVGCRKIEILL